MVQQPVHALGHLAGSLVGEGNGQNRLRRDAFFADQPGDAAGDHPRLARAGSGENQQGAFGGFDGCALFRVQIGELRLQEASPGGKSPGSSVPAGGKESSARPAVTVECIYMGDLAEI